jgi:hypothetical protein
MATDFLERRPPFEPRADYMETLQAFEHAVFTNREKGVVVDDGIVLAGFCAARAELLPPDSDVTQYSRDAETVRMVIVKTESDEGETFYRYDIRPLWRNGRLLGDEFTGIYRSSPSEIDWEGRTRILGERHRALLQAIQFDPLEAGVIAQDEVHQDSLIAGVKEGMAHEARLKRRKTLARWFGWLGFKE